jgi:hypothetical protein
VTKFRERRDRKDRRAGFSGESRDISPRVVDEREGVNTQVSPELIKAATGDIIDSTDRWWPPVKRMRDELAHREHTKIVFGSAEQGVLFQIYISAFAPVVIHLAVLWKHGQNVADFRIYSAAALSEIFVFLDDLGRGLASQLKMSVDGLTPSMRIADFSTWPVEREAQRRPKNGSVGR